MPRNDESIAKRHEVDLGRRASSLGRGLTRLHSLSVEIDYPFHDLDQQLGPLSLVSTPFEPTSGPQSMRSRRASRAPSPEKRAHDVDQLLRGLGLLGARRLGRIEQVEPDVAFDDLHHEAIDGATRRRHRLEDREGVPVVLEGPNISSLITSPPQV
jgi:hypothetical protein